MIFQHIVFVLLIILVVVVSNLCQTNALSIQHKFPQTKFGNRRSILLSEGFSSAIAFLDEVHKDRYSNNLKCPILGSSWKEYDKENNNDSEKSYSLNIDDDPESLFTSYSVKDQRRDSIPSSKYKRKGNENVPQKGDFGVFDASQSNNHSTANFDRKSDISKDIIDHGPLMPPTLFGQNFCHVTNVPIFTSEECETIIYEAETRNSGESNVWKSHEQYYKAMKITRHIGKELPKTRDFLRKACVERIFPLLQRMYPKACPQGVNGLRNFRIFSAKVLKYDASTLNDYLGVHHDGSLMTFLVALNKLEEYQGGGTYIEPLGRSIRYEQGHLLCHPGIIRHGGDKVTDGVRYVLAVWIDVYGVKEYDRQLCEEADLIRLGGRLDQSISLENKTKGGTVDGVSERAEKFYLYSLAAGEMFSYNTTSYIDANLCPRPTSENAWIGLGQLWLDQGSSAKASRAFKNALDLNPYNNRAWNSYGLSLIDLRDFDGALTAFHTAADLNDYEFEALSNLGLLQSMLGRHLEAIETFKKAVKRIQQNKDGSIKADKRSAAELYTNMGVTLCDLGRYNEAMLVFAKAVVIDPTFYDAATNLKAVREALAR